jgi:hypothetical protein
MEAQHSTHVCSHRSWRLHHEQRSIGECRSQKPEKVTEAKKPKESGQEAEFGRMSWQVLFYQVCMGLDPTKRRNLL